MESSEISVDCPGIPSSLRYFCVLLRSGFPLATRRGKQRTSEGEVHNRSGQDPTKSLSEIVFTQQFCKYNLLVNTNK